LIIQWLRDTGFYEVEYRPTRTREKLEWKEGFDEYYENMKKEIAELENSSIREAFRAKLEELKKETTNHGATSWSGIYLIQATA